MSEFEKTVLNILLTLGFPKQDSESIATNLAIQVILLTMNDFLNDSQKAQLNSVAEKNSIDEMKFELAKLSVDINELQTKYTLHSEEVLKSFFTDMLEQLPEDKIEEFKKIIASLDGKANSEENTFNRSATSVLNELASKQI